MFSVFDIRACPSKERQEKKYRARDYQDNPGRQLQVCETRTVISRCTGSSHPAADPWPRRRPYPLSVLHPRPSFRSQHRRPVHAAKFGLSELEQIFV